MQAGIDEAGRGPVLGPLVVAGVACDPSLLEGMGIKDSKRLTAGKRERIARLLTDHPHIRTTTEILAPAALDARRLDASLNDIEAEMFQRVALRLEAPHVIVDAADVDAKRFGRRIASVLAIGTTVISEHRADDRHLVVGAASIIAKVQRDAAIDELRAGLERRLGMSLGSGYPSDPKTRAFLAAWVERFGDVPPGTRRSWKTVHGLLGPRQALLSDVEAPS